LDAFELADVTPALTNYSHVLYIPEPPHESTMMSDVWFREGPKDPLYSSTVQDESSAQGELYFLGHSGIAEPAGVTPTSTTCTLQKPGRRDYGFGDPAVEPARSNARLA